MSASMKSFVAVSFLALAACSTPSTVATNTPRGKPSAPVAVTAELAPRSARVAVTFESDAEAVKIGVSGVDGLVVESEGVVVEQGKFTRGESKTFEVRYAPGEGRSQLVVSVSGTFNGSHRARVAAFGLGTGPLPDSGQVQTTSDGERVKVMTP
jgi:hypothetical protein